MEMVVVVVPVRLIPGGLTGQCHHIHHTVFNQALEVSVHRGQAQAGHTFLRLQQQLLGQQGLPHSGQGLCNRGSLTG
jgi:hypothetical protein